MPKMILRSAIVVVASVTVLGCSSEDKIVGTGNLALVASPDALFLRDNHTSDTIYFSTNAPGTLTWQVTAKPDWTTVLPFSGQVSQQIMPILVTADTAGLPLGSHTGKIQVISTGGNVEVAVRLDISAHPVAVVSPSTLSIPGGTTTTSFHLHNAGNGTLQWTIETGAIWLTAFPVSGWLAPRDSALVTVTGTRDGMDVGEFSSTVRVQSNSETGPIVIPVTMSVPQAPLLQLSRHELSFDYFVDTLKLVVKNAGNASFSWSANADSGFLSLSRTAGILPQRDSQEVIVTVNRLGLMTGELLSWIHISTDHDQRDSVNVTLRHFSETKWVLDHRVIDAEYDRNHDVIVDISDNPPRLNVLDPESRTQATVGLPLTPGCVSIRPDGLKAAVGHDGYVTLVDLVTMTVDQTYACTTDAIDVVLASNGWAYVFPRRDQWESIRCINLTTGVETSSSGYSIYAGTVAKLHPSGDYMYGADNGLSPSDFEKYDIRGGTATVMYDSPYHGDYAFSGNIWISDDGLRLFARSGNVFRSSAVQAEDMTYNGNLVGVSSAQWVEHSSAAGRIYAIDGGGWWGTPAPEIRVYETAYLAFKGTVRLPKFLKPDGSGGGILYDVRGQSVFVNKAGTRFHALMKADEASGYLMDWAVASFAVSSGP